LNGAAGGAFVEMSTTEMTSDGVTVVNRDSNSNNCGRHILDGGAVSL